MRDFKWLKERFGNAQAKTIKESKKELEASKGNSSIIYWMKNPDVPENEDIAIKFYVNLQVRICESFCTKPTQPTQLCEDFELCRV